MYVSNRAGSSDQTARNLTISNYPPGYTPPVVEPTAPESSWVTYGDTSANDDGSYRLNGNPGAVNDFVRTENEWSRPAYAEATFDAGWNEFYPLIEFVASPGKVSAIPDIGGYSNYKPDSSLMHFNGNSVSETYPWNIDYNAPLTLSVFADTNGNVTYTVTNGNN
jgi:hypothetical protein